MPYKVTIELIPRGDESRAQKLAIIRITNDGTGDQYYANYRVEAEGQTSEGGGWDSYAGFPITVDGVDRSDFLRAVAASLEAAFPTVKINEASVDVPPVRRSLPRLEELLHFIDGDRIEIKLYGNDGFDGQEILDGREYLKKWITEAVEEARGNDI